MGHATTFSSRTAMVFVSRGSAWLEAIWRSVDETRRAAVAVGDRGREATIIFAGCSFDGWVLVRVWRKERDRQKKRNKKEGNNYATILEIATEKE